MSTQVFKSKMKKDKTICNLRKANNLSCTHCICNSVCNPAYELYDKRRKRIYYLSEEEARVIFDKNKTLEQTEKLTGINIGTINFYRQLIKKGEFKDVRKVGPGEVACVKRKASGKEKRSKENAKGKRRAEKGSGEQV